MNKNKRQTVADVGILIVEDIEKQIEHIANLDSESDIKNEIINIKKLLESSKSILTLIERVNQKYGNDNEQ